MPARKAGPKNTIQSVELPLEEQVQAALSWLEQKSTPHDRENLTRFGITAGKPYGVSIANIQILAKSLGRNHELAVALWPTGWYEARLLTAFIADPARVTPAQMDRWCRDFDNWGICDTLCMHLFDRTPHAWAKVAEWSTSEEEFVKRAGYALLASLAGHDKKAGDQPFLDAMPLIEHGASDERHLVKKGVSWALRRIGTRNPTLRAAATVVAQRLASSPQAATRWVGKDALRDLTKPVPNRKKSSK